MEQKQDQQPFEDENLGLLGLDADALDQGLEDNIDTLTLMSMESKAVVVSKSAARISTLIQNTLEMDSECVEIPFYHIEEEILIKVVAYMHYHEHIAPITIARPLKSADMETLVDAFDAKFCDCEQEVLFKLMLAANYMHIKPLLDLTSAKMASLMKGLTPGQIRTRFSIRDDFTPEEEEAVRREHRNLM
jgi:S-phase kinase-associated protein 1